MPSPRLEIVILLYAIALATLWLLAKVLSPAGYQFSFWRCLGTAVLITIADNLLNRFLSPLIGEWEALVELLVDVLIVWGVLGLPIWRSIVVAIIYAVVMMVAHHFLVVSPIA
jgi:hypothetical protein